MRLRTPLLLVAGMCSLSGDLGFAQAPAIGTFLSDGGHAAITLTAKVTADDAPTEGVISAPTAGAADAAAPALVLPTLARLRPVDSGLATMIAHATAQSVTFRQLVQAIGETDGIVYVEHGRCGHGVRACLLAVTAAGTNRIVRVRVDAHKTDWDLMGSIGARASACCRSARATEGHQHGRDACLLSA